MGKGKKINKKTRDKIIYLIIIGTIALFKLITEDTLNITNDVIIDGVEVHFIDVGQGDSQLIIDGDQVMLIDAGENVQGENVVKYLKSLNIKKIDYIVGTHPHSDHIGGIDDVINNIEVDNIIIPKVTHTTKTYEDMIRAVKDNDVKVIEPVVGKVIEFDNTKYTILAPNSDYYEDNLNNYSVVLRMDHEEVSFIFTGDAEKYSENEMLENGLNLDIDVYKVSHHGSGTSNTPKFLEAISPSLAIISVGKDNDYNHPHDNAMDNIEKQTTSIYRTDYNGTVIVASDGENVSIIKEK